MASPTVAAGLYDPADLLRNSVIRDQGSALDRNVWLARHGLEDAVLPDDPVYSNASLCLDAAFAGQGVFLAWETLAFDALQMGRLVAPCPMRVATGLAHWFVRGA